MTYKMSRRTASEWLLGLSFSTILLLVGNASEAAEVELNAYDGHKRSRVSVLDSEISYVDVGQGDPIVFLHGNPTSSYLWRNIITQLSGVGRCLAPDLVGMGQSGSSPLYTYTFADHARYLDAWFEALGLNKNVTLVVHDWGSVLGFYRAARNPNHFKAIAYMEAIVMNRSWQEFGPFEQTFRTLRSPQGDQLVLEQNLFIEQVLPHAILRKLSEKEMVSYRAPFLKRDSRLPTLIWPREIPVEGQPADVAAILESNGRWLSTSQIPKLFINCNPGTMPQRAREFCRTWPNQREITVKGIHYVQEDSPNEISAGILDLLKRA